MTIRDGSRQRQTPVSGCSTECSRRLANGASFTFVAGCGAGRSRCRSQARRARLEKYRARNASKNRGGVVKRKSPQVLRTWGLNRLRGVGDLKTREPPALTEVGARSVEPSPSLSVVEALDQGGSGVLSGGDEGRAVTSVTSADLTASIAVRLSTALAEWLREPNTTSLRARLQGLLQQLHRGDQ